MHGFILPQEGENNNIRAGNPAAPGDTPLPLLPLGPDGIRKAPPRRTHPDCASIPDVKADVNRRYESREWKAGFFPTSLICLKRVLDGSLCRA